jgi:putative intracellular protease/amidase
MDNTTKKKILMVLTSHDELGNTGNKTGFWIEEFAAPYYVFADAGAEITIASPKGGQPPIDPTSTGEGFQTDATRRFDGDEAGRAALAQSTPLGDINASEYDAVFYPGGHGPLWDLVSDKRSIALIETLFRQNKPVAAVCHASAVLLDAKDEAGQYIVAGKEVTGFTNTEEAAVELTDIVPLLVEDALVDRGGKFAREADWGVCVRRDGNLITGQNPASSEAAAKLVIEALS